MPSIGNRQVVVAVLLAATLVLAGCSGGGNTTPTDGNTTDGSVEATAEGDATVEAEVPPLDYQWQEGESYTYESEAVEGGSSQYTWEVTDVSGGEVTAEVVTSFGGNSETSTITGPQGAVLQNGSDASGTTIFTALQAFRRIAVGETLETGESWTISSGSYDIGGSQQEVDVTVTGTSTVQGVQCHDLEMTVGNQTFTGCIDEDWPFALSASFSLATTTTTGGETGSARTVTYTLVEADRP